MGRRHRNRARELRLHDLRHRVGDHLQQDLLLRHGPDLRDARVVRRAVRRLRRPPARRAVLLQVRRPARPQVRHGGHAVPDGHRDVRDRPAAHLRHGRHLGADPAADGPVPAGLRRGRRAGQRHRAADRDRPEGQARTLLVAGVRRCCRGCRDGRRRVDPRADDARTRPCCPTAGAWSSSARSSSPSRPRSSVARSRSPRSSRSSRPRAPSRPRRSPRSPTCGSTARSTSPACSS